MNNEVQTIEPSHHRHRRLTVNQCYNVVRCTSKSNPNALWLECRKSCHISLMIKVVIRHLVHRENTFHSRTDNHSIGKKIPSRDACMTHFEDNNQAVFDSSSGRSCCWYLLTSFSKQTRNHCSGLYAVLPSTHSNLLVSENIPHPPNKLVDNKANITRYSTQVCKGAIVTPWNFILPWEYGTPRNLQHHLGVLPLHHWEQRS